MFFEIEELIETANSTTITFIIVAIGIQIIATIVIVGSGFPGGIFAPSLLIGALIAKIFVQILNIDDPALITAWLIVGMSGSHASTTKTPVACVLLILEITGLPNLIIPMVLANISACISSSRRSFYKGQLRSRDAAIFRHLKEYDQHEEYTVSDVMTSIKDVFHFHSYTLLSDVLEIYESSGKRDFPVILSEDDSKLIDILHEEEIVKINILI